MADIKRIEQLPHELRGPSQNRWGGHRTQKLRAYRSNTYGAASECRSFTHAERRAWAAANDYSTR